MNSRALVEGLGCGVLLTLWLTSGLLSPYHVLFLHARFPLSTVFLGALVELIALSLLAALVWAAADRLRPENRFWSVAAAGIVSFEVYSLAKIGNQYVPHLVLAGLFAAVLLLGLGLRWRRVSWFKRMLRLIRGSLVLAGFSAIWMIPELVYLAVRTSAVEPPGFGTTASLPSAANQPRIAWILFDELSYNQVFEHRWPGLALPNFDRLHAESVTFSDVLPAGNYTDRVIPSFFLGETVSKVRSSTTGELLVYLAGAREWRRFNPSKSIFADARRLGWTSGIAGWFNPYCRVEQGWTDRCYGSSEEPFFESNMDPRLGVLANAKAPILSMLSHYLPGSVPERYGYLSGLRSSHQRDYQLLLKQAQDLLRDSAIRFSYIHIGIPHPPGIYDRKTHEFSSRGSYIDNLSLTDQALGELLDTLEGTPGWSQTTLIVCSDHSWRTAEWIGIGWTPEDQAASGGRFDTRPTLLIHFPGQTEGSTVASAFPALMIHDMLEGLLQDKIHSPAELSPWTTPSRQVSWLSKRP